jgi:hypothetical protein
MNTYLNEKVQQDIKKVFELRYKRPLSKSEVFEIAENLSETTEEILKFRWKQKYENK